MDAQANSAAQHCSRMQASHGSPTKITLSQVSTPLIPPLPELLVLLVLPLLVLVDVSDPSGPQPTKTDNVIEQATGIVMIVRIRSSAVVSDSRMWLATDLALCRSKSLE